MGGVATLVFTPVSGSITPQASYICIGFLANNRVFLQLRIAIGTPDVNSPHELSQCEIAAAKNWSGVLQR